MKVETMKHLFLLIVALSFGLSLSAQQRGGNPKGGQRTDFNIEQYKKHMCDFIAKEAQLTPEEQQKLFPMVEEMLKKQHQIMGQQGELMRKAFRNPQLSEEDCQMIINKGLEYEIQSKKIEQTYYKKFHTVISWNKALKVRGALMRFNREALRRFNPGPPPPQQRKQD